jgi:hypothetical protein
MSRNALAAALVAAALGGGCAAAPKMYHWGSYDADLYAHYRAPQEGEAWAAGLQQVVAEAEQEGRKVPPGLLAEYGYALYEQGAYAEAIAQFSRERELWPESKVLMDKMIALAGRRAAQAPATPRKPAAAAAVQPAVLEGGKP